MTVSLGPNRLRTGRLGLGLGARLILRSLGHRDVSFEPGQFDRGVAGDLALTHLLLRIETRLVDDPLGGDLGQLDLLARIDPGLVHVPVPLRLPCRDLRLLLRAPERDLLLLLKARVLFLLGDLELETLRFEVLFLDRDLCVLLDLVARPAPRLDLRGQLGQSLCVEGVVGVEVLAARLIEARERDRFELQAVVHDLLGQCLPNRLDEGDALLVQLLHVPLGRHRAQRVHELPFQQRPQLLCVEGLRAQRLRGGGDRLRVGPDSDEELGRHVDPHAIASNQRVLVSAREVEQQGLHVDGGGVVQNRQNERSAVHDDLLAAEPGTHERHLLRRALVEPPEQKPRDPDDGKDHDDDQDYAAGAHCYDLPCRGRGCSAGRRPVFSKLLRNLSRHASLNTLPGSMTARTLQE